MTDIILEKVMLKNQVVEVISKNTNHFNYSITIEDWIKKFQDIHNLHRLNYSNLRIRFIELTRGTRIELIGDRWETDEELAIRQSYVGKPNKKQRKEQELREKELAELARLKAKYEI